MAYVYGTVVIDVEKKEADKRQIENGNTSQDGKKTNTIWKFVFFLLACAKFSFVYDEIEQNWIEIWQFETTERKKKCGKNHLSLCIHIQNTIHGKYFVK